MKKMIVIGLIMLLLTGCRSEIGQNQSPSTEVPQSSVQTSSAGKVISPLPSTINLADLGDCTLAVGFVEKRDAYMDGGRFVIRMDVYDYELFDLVDMSMLQAGDTIVVSGQRVLVNSLTEENGAKLINGGMEQGGYTFHTNNCGVYFSVSYNDRLDYYKVGEVVLPVAQEFTLVDSSDLETGPRTTYPGDMIVEAPQSDAVFMPDNTQARIVNGYVQQIQVSYLP